jgi:putative transposase
LYSIDRRWVIVPRSARRKSGTNTYHIMIRGINRQNIFIEDEDNERFLNTLARYHKEIGYEIYAYCLMSNHVHLLIKEGNETLSNTMKRIGASYVYWYNWQYNRKGHLFKDRYKSEPVESSVYFLTALRYIHQNPLKAGLVNSIESYQWSSYKEYITESKLLNVDFVLKMFHENRDTALKMFTEFNMKTNDDKCLEMAPERKTISDKEIMRIVLDKYNIELALLHGEQPTTQIKVLKYLKNLEGSSLRQLSRLTGFTVNKIYRA